MNVSLMEACSLDLFSDADVLEGKYPGAVVDGVLRVRDLYQRFCRMPSTVDRTLVKDHCARFGISRPTAYGDLAVLKGLLPTLGREAREFHRWRAKEMLLETYRIALAKKDVRTMERIASSYARVFRVDSEEEVRLPFEEIVPPAFVPTDDPTVLGLPRLENREEKIRQLLEELRVKDPDVVDVQYEEADIAPIGDV